MHFSYLFKKIFTYLMTRSFANVLYLSVCLLGNCSCFYFRLLTFFKIKFLQINHQGPLWECQTVWTQIKTDIYLGPNFCKGNRQMTKFSTGMRRVISGKTLLSNAISHIGNSQLGYIYMCILPKSGFEF